MEIQTTFSYAALPEETQTILARCEEEILSRLKRTAEDIVVIGQRLIEAKQALGHGKFQAWLNTAFDMTYRTAHQFMLVAEKFHSKSEIISLLPVTIIYQLAEPANEPIAEAVIAGNIAPTPEAIKPALAQAKQERATRLPESEGDEEEWENNNTVTLFPSEHTPMYPVLPSTPADVVIPTKGEVRAMYDALPPVSSDHLIFPRVLSQTLHAIDTVGSDEINAWLDVASPETIPDRLTDLHQIEQWCSDIRRLLTASSTLRILR